MMTIYDDRKVQQWVFNCMRMCGFRTTLVGYHWIKESIICCIRDHNGVFRAFRRHIFPQVKNPDKVSYEKAERNMRYAIKQAFNEGNSLYQQSLLGHSYIPTVNEFIAAAAERCVHELENR